MKDMLTCVFCSFSCLVAKMMITFEKKSHTKHFRFKTQKEGVVLYFVYTEEGTGN